MDKGLLSQGIYLLITSLLGGVVALVVYIWHGASRDTYRKMSKMEKCVESHNERIIVIEVNCKNCKGKRK